MLYCRFYLEVMFVVFVCLLLISLGMVIPGCIHVAADGIILFFPMAT